MSFLEQLKNELENDEIENQLINDMLNDEVSSEDEEEKPITENKILLDAVEEEEDNIFDTGEVKPEKITPVKKNRVRRKPQVKMTHDDLDKFADAVISKYQKQQMNIEKKKYSKRKNEITS
tara:strand:- start:1012 stop:1374 length:363 start_codon:yes stop_codon:yes gene_type:complete